jgi:hypothetical protein
MRRKKHSRKGGRYGDWRFLVANRRERGSERKLIDKDRENNNSFKNDSRSQ